MESQTDLLTVALFLIGTIGHFWTANIGVRRMPQVPCPPVPT